MANIVFNRAKGRVAEIALLPGANDAFLLVLLKAAGLEADAVLRDYDDLAAILAAANDECDFTGYTRRTLAGTAINFDDTNDRVDVSATSPSSYTNSGGASQAAGKALVVYDPDTTTGTDSTVVPLVALDCVITFDVGVPATLSFDAAGWFRAA